MTTYLPVCGDSTVPWLPPRLPSLPRPVLPAPLAPEPLADAPDVSSDFLDFFSFLALFLALGLSSEAALLAPVPEEPDVADGEESLLPLVALGLVDDAPDAPVEPVPLDPLEPDALLPLVPEAPDEVSLEPEVPLPDAPDDMPLLPEEPDALLPDGIALELPLALPESVPVALGERVVDDGVVSLVPLVALLCASAMEDTDATTTNDSERRVVLNVMSNSLLLLEKRHHRCSTLDAAPRRAFSTAPGQFRRKPLMFL